MRMTIKKRLIFGFGILLLLFIVFGIVVLDAMANVQGQFGFVIEHDAPVLANANRLLKLVVDMETGQRGFCITQKEEFLEPYNSANDEFHKLLDTEKELVSDNPSQVKVLERIHDLVKQWHEKAAVPEISMARKVAMQVVDAQHLQDVIEQGVGKELMDRFMALGHEIEVSFSGQGDWEGAFAVEIIEKCMADREDGQRGFLITGKEEFLDKYIAGEQKKLPENFARLRAIVSQRGRQEELSKRIDQLEQLGREWTIKAAEPEIAIRREMNKHPESLKSIAALLIAGTGKDLLDKIRADFDRFIKVEEELTSQRYATASQATLNTKKMTLFLVVFSIIFGSIVAALIIQTIIGSIGRLLNGMKIIGAGDLKHRIEIKSKDEIGQLAVAFNQMVDKRQQTEEKLNKSYISLEQSDNKSRALLESTPAGIIEIDRQGNITFVNPMIEKIFGYIKDELIGEKIEILLPGKFRNIHPNHRQKFFSNPQARSMGVGRDLQGKRKDGTEFPVEIGLNSIETTDGVRAIAFITDITMRKQAEEELRKARKSAETANKAKSDFLANMSHEIRTPLTAIIGYTDILVRQTKNDPKTEETLSIIKKNGGYLLALINDILDLAKIESGKLKLETVDCSIIQILHSCMSIFHAQTNEKGIDLKLEWLSAMPETIKSDPVRLKQILMNILSNAIKFTEKGSVVITAEVIERGSEAELNFTISDTGVGIKKEKLAEIFKPFDQADTSITRNYGGTGLGLTITRKLMDKFDGQIAVESEYGKGSKFTLTFPIGPKDSLQMNDEPDKMLLKSRDNSKDDEYKDVKFQGKILLADDTISNQLLFGEMLTMMGLDVDIVGNGKEALESVETGIEYDLILMDLHMPVMSGYEALSKIRQIKKEQIVIALTADAMTETVQQCKKVGFSAYASKPIVYNDIVNVLSKYLTKTVEDSQGDDTVEQVNKEQKGFPICPEKALEQLNVSMESYLDVLGKSLDSINSLNKSISDAIEKGDFESVRENAHALKNTAGTLAITSVYDKALDIETKAKANQQQDVKDAYSRLNADVSEAVDYAEQLLLKD